MCGVHRHRSLHELSVQAAEVAATLLGRVGGPPPLARSSTRADGTIVPLNLAERPPLAATRHDCPRSLTAGAPPGSNGSYAADMALDPDMKTLLDQMRGHRRPADAHADA